MAYVDGGSKGYNSSARVSPAPGAFYVAYAGDFGPASSSLTSLTYEASSGSFASETVYVAVTWVTNQGEGIPGPTTGVQISSAQGAIKVIVPAPPALITDEAGNAATVIGFRLYDSTTTTGLLLVTGVDSFTTQVSLTTTEGGTIANAYAEPATPAAVTVYLKKLAVGAASPTFDESGVQAALPLIASDTTVDYYFIVPNTGSQWKVQKSVEYMRSDGIADPSGIQIGHMDCLQPTYPGTNIAAGTAQSSWTVNPGSFMVMNGYLFVASNAGGAAAPVATTFIGWAAFNTTKYATTTDGTVVWICLGKAAVVRSVFGNLSASAAAPAPQTYELFEV